MFSEEEKSAIARVVQEFEDAWARRDMTAFRALLTEDCDWVNIVGMHWHGSDEVTEMHRVLLHGRYKGVNVQTVSHEVSEIAPGVALVVQKSQLDDFTTPDGQVVRALQTMGIMVIVKRDGKWLIRASENSSIDPRASMKPTAK
ncbi:SgcJ/EcaC family oxidoreductase [Granulicella cerasi]|uniref:SgcJ/EcaC family oxidoreductase n=1 Tax=Granulicella cerasi TaxID=741063 RepID=A0ABW1ZDZ2_9BACT|nr:SgcJ/EcaC family oxidoreductase [Granulicella cerasi]